MTEDSHGDRDNLKAQADLLREALQHPSGRPGLFRRGLPARVLSVALLIGALTLALWLAFSQPARDGLFRRLVVEEDPASQASTITIRNLPQPEAATGSSVARSGPDRRLETTRTPGPSQTPRLERSEVLPGAPPASGEPAAPTPGGNVSADTGSAAESAPAPSSQPQVSKEAEMAAYNLVLSTQSKMQQLVMGSSSRWFVVKDDGGILWVDIVVATDQEEHYIWAVDLQKHVVEPLSHAARNLQE